jgi:hypothetical protein
VERTVACTATPSGLILVPDPLRGLVFMNILVSVRFALPPSNLFKLSACFTPNSQIFDVSEGGQRKSSLVPFSANCADNLPLCATICNAFRVLFAKYALYCALLGTTTYY